MSMESVGLPDAPPSLSRAEKWGLLALIAVLAFWWNRQFVGVNLNTVLANDVASRIDLPNIVQGYRAVPNLLWDGLRWWHGPRIEGTPSFRPLASYLLWIETWISLRWGIERTGWIGYGLLVLNATLSAGMAWRFTGSKLAAVCAGSGATLCRSFVGADVTWLA